MELAHLTVHTHLVLLVIGVAGAQLEAVGKKTVREEKFEIGASEGIRTLDIHLGKVTLYQAELRSLPFRRAR